ncbi:uncharacterized protein M6B38_339110 [Iris pallida]|uniref:LSM12 LSM domain-containing protein n=1 Tax=Iris pallida TaxID=29817 RepID=A0AAX6H078_IRIPA|nr:uncharacterized protein M6B38_339110 [Iris pallida]
MVGVGNSRATAMDSSVTATTTAAASSIEDSAVGYFISVTTIFGEEIRGQIITYDRQSNLLVIHILPLFFIIRFITFFFFFFFIFISFCPALTRLVLTRGRRRRGEVEEERAADQGDVRGEAEDSGAG